MLNPFDDAYWMREALKEAQKAYQLGEVPVGAVIVAGNRIIGKGHNLTEHLNDVTAHAEMQAITAAANQLGGKYLQNCRLYVTLEPCVMCAGALFWSQIGAIYAGAPDPKRGCNRFGQLLHPKTHYHQGLLETDCSQLLKQFFTEKRLEKK
ncbi:MAG: nucleoside deaminase [Bacteroidia bacterium]